MEICHAYGCPYEDYENAIMELAVKLDVNETVSVGDIIKIEMMDDSVIERKVKIINPKKAGDFYLVSKEARESNWGRSKKPVLSVTGECQCNLVVLDCDPTSVKTEENITAEQAIQEMQSRVCITPYKELHLGEESIFDYIDHSFSVPDKVILYLQTKDVYFLCPGIYPHPFKENNDLLGPYVYTDGHYYWDRDTWKYVVKFGLTLPEEFVDYVMSDEADALLNQQHNSDWHLQLSKRENVLNLLPEDSGDIPLEQF